MRELNKDEARQVAGGLTGSGQIFGPEEIGRATRLTTGLGLLSGAGAAGWKAGTHINDNYISDQTGDAIGHTVHRLIHSPGESIRDAINHWF